MDERLETPDLKWARAVAEERGVSTRCPFGSTRRCPRYYESLSLLGEQGLSTKLSEEEDARLLREWQLSDLWPEVLEKASSVWGNAEKRSFSNFCPEVSYDFLGYFASDLFPYGDELDFKSAQSYWSTRPIGAGHWSSSWASVRPLHYTDCPLYSILAADPTTVQPMPRRNEGLIRKIAVLCKDYYTLRTIDDLFLFAGARPDSRGSVTESHGSQRMDRVYEWVNGLEANEPERIPEIVNGVAAQIASNEEVPERDRAFLRRGSGTSEALSTTPSVPRRSAVPESIDDLLEYIIRGLPRAMGPLKYRRAGTEALGFQSEYDVQALFHALIIPWVKDIRAEEYTPSYAGASTRVDFLLPDHGLVVELKHIRDRRHAKEVGNELLLDIAHYSSHPKCQRLWAVVYDPNGRIQNPDGLMKDLEGEKHLGEGTLEVRAWVLQP